MRHAFRSLAFVILMSAAAACNDARSPTGPAPFDGADAAVLSKTTTAVSATEGFAFLPPIGPANGSGGTLLVELAPFLTVEVCRVEGDGCGSVIARYTEDDGGGDGRLRVAGDHFRVNWKVSRDLAEGADYRLRVRVGPMELGHVGVEVARKGPKPKDGGDLVVTPGSTVPVRFRVEDSPAWDLPSTVEFAEAETVAGRVLELFGASPSAAADLELLVHGAPAPIRQLDDGRLLAAVPLFLGGGSWPAPPADALDLMLFVDGQPVAWTRGAVTVTPPADAPGSAMEALSHLTTMAGAWQAFAASPAGPSVEEAWGSAAVAAFETLVDGAGPGSLRHALESADPEQLRLLDAWFAGSGVLEALREYGDRLETVADGFDDAAQLSLGTAAAPRVSAGSPALGAVAAPSMSTATSIGTIGTQYPANYLAGKAQLYEVVRLLGEVVIGETASEFGTYVGLAAGAIGTVASVPAAGVVGAVLSVADFVINKLLVGLLPAQVDALSLEIPDHTIGPGEQTIADVRIQARNDPPDIGILDVIGQVLTVVGLPSSPDVQNFVDVLIDVGNFYLGVMQSALSAYAADHPELGLNPAVTSLPEMVWWSTVFDETLVLPQTLAPQLLTPVADGIDWVAADDRFGDGRVYVRVNNGPDAHRLDLPAGISYDGGAFGADIVQSEPVTVTVAGELALRVEFADVIEPDGFNVLEARAGYLEADGDTAWIGGIWIELVVDGGSVEEVEGPTDADGQFITLARLDEGSDDIIITVSAFDDTGQSESVTVEAAALDPDPGATVRVARRSSEAFTDANASACVQSDSDREKIDFRALGPFSGSANASAQASHTTQDGSLSATATANGSEDSDVTVAPDGSSLVVTGNGSWSANADWTRSGEPLCGPFSWARASASASANSSLSLVFDIEGGSMVLEVSGSLSSANGGARSFLLGPTGSLFQYGQARGGVSASFSETLVLEPGRYSLFVGGGIRASQDPERDGTPSDGGSWSVELSLTRPE